MKNTWTKTDLDDLSSLIIRRTVATRVPMSNLENEFVNETSFVKRAEMADAVQAKVGEQIRTLVKAIESNDEGDPKDRDRAVDEFVAKITGKAGAPGGAGSLSHALTTAGFSLRTKAEVGDIPIETATGYQFGFKAGSLDGGTDIENVSPIRVTQSPLGYDERFLAPHLPTQGIAFTDTAVQGFSQKSRNLGTATDGVRAIGAVTTKPEVGSVFEVSALETKQIAWKQSGTPNILMEQPSVRGFIDYDLRLAFARSVDSHILSTIAAASPQTSGTGANELEQILYAREVIRAQGYSPNMVVMSPQDGLAMDLLIAPGTGDYLGDRMKGLISEIQRVEVPGLTTTYLLDTRAAGTFFVSPARLQAFEENDGATNTTLVRLEATGVFRLERVTAICKITPGFGS